MVPKIRQAEFIVAYDDRYDKCDVFLGAEGYISEMPSEFYRIVVKIVIEDDQLMIETTLFKGQNEQKMKQISYGQGSCKIKPSLNGEKIGISELLNHLLLIRKELRRLTYIC